MPLERIRPASISQQQWEATFAWPPPGDRPPYPPLSERLLHVAVSYVVVIGGAAVLLQVFAPFPVLIWFVKLMAMM